MALAVSRAINSEKKTLLHMGASLVSNYSSGLTFPSLPRETEGLL
jgi:hypothetical protein